MAITTPQNFIVISQHENTEAMRLEIVQLLEEAGHHSCQSVFEKPLIFIFLSIEDEMIIRVLDDGTELTTKTWLRTLTDSIRFGGYAILYSRQLPPDQQALLKKDENFDADEVLNTAKDQLVLAFSASAEILQCFEALPDEFALLDQ